jgi:hypothetical protein
MKRITSITNAIKYFEKGTKVETRKDSKGEEYKVYIPPVGFHRLNVSQRIYDTLGRRAGTMTRVFQSFQYKDYISILQRDKEKITKIVLYYE